MKKNGFTVLEIIVVTIIVGILATLGLPYFQNVMESSKERVCDTNLKALQKAVEIYTIEHDTVPGSLSLLDYKTVEKAYASVMSGKGAWERWLAYLIVEGPQWGIAYAQGYGMPHLKCPSNPNTSAAQISYGLNAGLSNLTSFQYKDLLNSTIIVADSAKVLFSYSAAPVVSITGQTYTYSGPSTDFSGYNDVIQRGHKKFRPLSSADFYLRGATKDGGIGIINSTAFKADASPKW